MTCIGKDMIKGTIFVLVWSFLCCFLLAGCASSNNLDLKLSQLKTRAQGAYHCGLDAMIQEAEVNIDGIWALKKILKLSPNEKLEQFIDDKTMSIKKHPSLRLINANASFNNLPENPGVGINLYSNYLRAPFGKPQERAISFINDFTKTEESGYILTHQFFVLIWAEEMGLELPRKLQDRKNIILGRILKEQYKAESFSDLYAERAAILLHWANLKPKDVAEWINKIVNAQTENGKWPAYSFILFYDGQSAVVEPPVSHTAVLSLWALQSYLNTPLEEDNTLSLH